MIIAVVNESTTVTDTAVRDATHAFNRQVRDDFGPAWGVTGRVVYHSRRTKPPADAWIVAILDDSDQADALGYHDVTIEGHPVAKVFAGTDHDLGLSWTVTATHEITEMLADPECNLGAQITDTLWVGYEVADPVEADQYGYYIDDVLVTDWVYPSWFRPEGQPPYDFTAHLTEPLTLLPGGYVSLWNPQKGWHQVFAETSTDHNSRVLRAHRINRRGPAAGTPSANKRIMPDLAAYLLDLGSEHEDDPRTRVHHKPVA